MPIELKEHCKIIKPSDIKAAEKLGAHRVLLAL